MCSSVTAWPPRWQEQLILRQQLGFMAGPALSFHWEPISQRPAETRGPSSVRQASGWVLVWQLLPRSQALSAFPGCYCRRAAEVFIHFTPHCVSQAGCVWGSSGHSAVILPCVGGASWSPGTGALHSVTHTTREASLGKVQKTVG